MNPMLDKVMDAAAGIGAAAVLGAIWLNLRWLFSSKRSMERILSELICMRSNVTILFRMQGPVLMSLKASLEAQRDGQCNGNVDKALEMIEEAKKEFDNHLLKTLAEQGDGAGKAGYEGVRGYKGTGGYKGSGGRP